MCRSIRRTRYHWCVRSTHSKKPRIVALSDQVCPFPRDRSCTAVSLLDGRLVCAGSKDGIVRVFDFETRTQLRHFKEHLGSPVHCTRFSRDKTYIFTGSDDRTVRVLDLATEKQLSKFDHVHTDYVRALTPGSTTNPHLLLSGSYDRTMKLIDRRMPNNENILMRFDHGDQIESVRQQRRSFFTRSNRSSRFFCITTRLWRSQPVVFI